MVKTYTWSCQCIIYYNGTQTILTQQVDFWFYSKDEATIFYANIQNFNDFTSFEYKAKLLGNRVAQIDPNQTDQILENFAIAVSIKYLNNFWISLEMPLINCNVDWNLDGQSILFYLHSVTKVIMLMLILTTLLY